MLRMKAKKKQEKSEKLASINFLVSLCSLCEKSWEIRGRKLFVSTNRQEIMKKLLTAKVSKYKLSMLIVATD
jgi:transcription antitermination factor NusA-like protein